MGCNPDGESGILLGRVSTKASLEGESLRSVRSMPQAHDSSARDLSSATPKSLHQCQGSRPALQDGGCGKVPTMLWLRRYHSDTRTLGSKQRHRSRFPEMAAPSQCQLESPHGSG